MALDQAQTQILGAALVELLDGKLTDETIAAIDSIKREDVSDPLENLVGYMHGMSTYPPLREGIITSLIEEIRGAATEALEKRVEHPTALSDWGMMYNILEQVMEGGDYVLRGTADMCAEAGIDLVNPERLPAWARPLAQHIKDSKTRMMSWRSTCWTSSKRRSRSAGWNSANKQTPRKGCFLFLASEIVR